ncbi:GDSL-type esterase/lipase family protein [Bacillus cereus]|nr:GDSL-type esterase/lipase family protein [Bacillus cereus]
MADAPLVLLNDELPDGTEKINKGIKNANEALKRSITAHSDASNALNISNDAKEKADDVEKQLTEIVVNGDSSVEAAAARVGTEGESHDDLKKRLDEEFKRAKLYREKQSYLYARFFRKLRLKESVIIECPGDSLTYGYDMNSADRRPPSTNSIPDGSTHKTDRASKTYPESLDEFLDIVYEGRVQVINRGYSGDGVKQGYNRWIEPSGSHISINCYGTNDSREPGTGYPGDIKEFLKWYRKMIERQLDWGSAVILMTPPKNRYDANPDSYENAVFLLGEEYGIPVIKTDEMIAGYSPAIYSDGTHFNGKGYTIWASRIAALFVGKGPKKIRHVSDGSTLLSREYIDNVVYNSGAYMRSNAGYPTPNEVTDGQGIGAFIGPGGKATWSFYLETDDMVVLPTAYLEGNNSLKLTLDFGVQQADVCIDYLYGYPGVNHTVFPASTVSWKVPNDFPHKGSVTSPYFFKWGQPMLTISGKGWHTITAELVGSDTVSVLGLSFFSYHDLMKIKTVENVVDKRKGYLKFKTHNHYSETNDVRNTSIKMQDIIDAVGYPEMTSYWENPPLKVTVHNWDANILEYVVTVGNRGAGNKFSVGIDVKETKIVANPAADKIRKLDSVSFNVSTDEIILNWGGATARATEFTVSLL